MKTSSDRQPFYCQNTFYKQFISVYKFTQDLKTHPGASHNSSPSPPLRSEGATNWANSDIIKQKSSKLQLDKRSPRPNIIILNNTDKLLCCVFCPTHSFLSQCAFCFNVLLSGLVGNSLSDQTLRCITWSVNASMSSHFLNH